jgi:hypothetical protein
MKFRLRSNFALLSSRKKVFNPSSAKIIFRTAAWRFLCRDEAGVAENCDLHRQ